MTDTPFTNRELTTMFDSITKKLDDHADVHAQILEQVKTTNGKVAEIQRWRERMVGAMWAGSVLFSLVIFPLIGWAIFEINSLDEKIANALDNYEIRIAE